MIRRILAILIGAGVAFGLVALIEQLGHNFYPPPPGIDFTDPADVGEYIKQAPMGAFMFILAAWVIAAIVGGIIAAFIARKLLFVFIVGGLILIASGVNLFMIPHPTWFSVTGIIAIIVGILIAKRMARAIFRLS